MATLARLFTGGWRQLFTTTGQYRLTTALVLLSLLPFVALSFYSHPALDDFTDAVLRQRLGFGETQRTLYLQWTGRFTTSLLLTELSLVYHGWLELYYIVPLATLLGVMAGLYFLVTAVVLGWSVADRALASGVLLALWLQQASSVSESLYWFNGVVVYTIPAALLFCWLAAAAGFWQSRDESSTRAYRRLVLMMVLGIVLIGTNEVLALPLVLAVGMLTLRSLLRRSKHRAAFLLLALVLSAASLVSFFAPGNFIRASAVGQPLPLAQALALTVGASAYMLINWFSSGVLLAGSVLAFPALARLAERPSAVIRELSSISPVALLTSLFLLLVVAGAPSYWATGQAMPPRARAMVYLLFVAAWFILLLSVMVRYRQQHFFGRLKKMLVWPAPAAALGWTWLLVSFATDHNLRLHQGMGQASNNVVLAYRDWLSGKAKQYDAQQLARYQLLHRSKAQQINLEPLRASPPTLHYQDISNDPSHWGNQGYAQYFGKRAVWVRDNSQQVR